MAWEGRWKLAASIPILLEIPIVRGRAIEGFAEHPREMAAVDEAEFHGNLSKRGTTASQLLTGIVQAAVVDPAFG